MPSVAIIGTRGYPSFYGGFETAVRNLAPYLAEAGWDVTVYGRQHESPPEGFTPDDRVTSVVTRGFDTRSLSTLSYGASASLHTLRKRPDAALVMNVANGFYLPFLRAARIPTLVNVDGIEWDRAKWGRLAKSMFKAGARLTASHATELVMDAVAIDARWRKEFGRGGTFIPYGGEQPQPSEAPLGLAHRGYVIAVARFVPENSIAEFFAAVPKIAAKYPVVIVGSEGYNGEFDAHAARLDAEISDVRWLGHLKDDALLMSLWQHAGVYFHGHTVGGTNPALVQAMMAGAPVVARDTVYNAEVLADSRQVSGGHPDEIFRSVLSLMDDPALQSALSLANMERAKLHYNWPDICARYESALNGIIDRQKGRGSRAH